MDTNTPDTNTLSGNGVRQCSMSDGLLHTSRQCLTEVRLSGKVTLAQVHRGGVSARYAVLIASGSPVSDQKSACWIANKIVIKFHIPVSCLHVANVLKYFIKL